MTTSYYLAIDVGTSRTAAATARQADDGTLFVTSFPLGRHADSAPSVVFVSEGGLLFGDAALRRGIAQPERLIREFKRRIGDEVPLLAGDQRFLAEQLYARTVAWVIESVSEREGARPEAISIAVPVTWTPFRLDLVTSALAREGWAEVDVIAEPLAAARHYESDRVLENGDVLAVYDLGGGTFDAALLRKDGDDDLAVVGAPVGIAAFGGSDFDDLVLRHAISAAGLSAAALQGDPSARVGLAALGRECIEAKESLSFDSESVVPVLVPPGNATVRLTRSEFEGMIEEGIGRTIAVLADAFEAAGVNLDDVTAILLTGGSSRIPRVAQLLSERFDRPIAVDADPKAIIALGAARAVAERELWAAYYAAGGDDTGAEDAETARAASGAPDDAPSDAAGDAAGKQKNPDAPSRRRWPRRGTRPRLRWGTATIVTTGALMLAVAGGVAVGIPLLSGASSADEPAPSSSTTTPPLTSLPSMNLPTELPSPAVSEDPATTESASTAPASTPPATTAPPLLTPAPPAGRIGDNASDAEGAEE